MVPCSLYTFKKQSEANIEVAQFMHVITCRSNFFDFVKLKA